MFRHHMTPIPAIRKNFRFHEANYLKKNGQEMLFELAIAIAFKAQRD